MNDKIFEVVSPRDVVSHAAVVYKETRRSGYTKYQYRKCFEMDEDAIPGETHYERKRHVLNKIDLRFASMTSFVNRTLLPLYKCNTCKKPLYGCYKQLGLTNDCNDLLLKSEMNKK